MSALKFDVLDLIREPDNYLPGERAKASEAIAELLESVDALLGCMSLAGWEDDPIAVKARADLARFGGAK